jgi:hypothetical protein
VTTATAVTYRSGAKRGQLRTVLLASARHSVVLLPTGRLEILTGTPLHGETCRCQFWQDAIAADPGNFAVPAEAVVQVREVGPVKTRKGSCK